MTAWALHTDLDLDTLNLRFPELEAAGLLGIVEEDGRATAYFPHQVDHLGLDGRWEAVADQDWHAAWQQRLEPVVVGPFTIAPPWRANPGPGVVVIEPGQAFGTGHHETTTGCLAALCELTLAGRAVLDVGTGSGVLAIGAALLGATKVVAVDTDPLAVEATTHNATVNEVELLVVEGSVPDVPAGRFDVVVANLDTAALVTLAGELVGRLAPGGALIVSGVGIERAGEAVEAFAAAGLAVIPRPGREWVVLTGRG